MGWGKDDTKKATGDSSKQVSAANHTAREDAQKAGDLPERAANKSGKSGSDKKKS